MRREYYSVFPCGYNYTVPTEHATTANAATNKALRMLRNHPRLSGVRITVSRYRGKSLPCFVYDYATVEALDDGYRFKLAKEI